MTDWHFSANTAFFTPDDGTADAFPIAWVEETLKGGTLRVRCPYCHQTHIHGAGGHTSAHCVARRIPRTNRWTPKPEGCERGYYVLKG